MAIIEKFERTDYNTFSYVKDGDIYKHVLPFSIMIESENDLEDLSSDDYPPGSIAFTAGYVNMWQLSAAGTWTVIGE